MQRDTQEKLLLQLIVEKFDKKKETASFTATSSGSKQKHADDQLPPVSMAEDNRIVDKGNLMMMMRERELNGTDRFAVDGFLSTDGCQTLMDLADVSRDHFKKLISLVRVKASHS